MQPVHYHRIAYYSLFLKQVINDPPGAVHQNDPSVWADINPIGLWRCLRCRIFDGNGAMTGYAFTTNPAWLARRSLNSARVFSSGGYTFVELTLSGGELVCFGQGLAAASTAVVIPDGYSLSQSILLAMPRTAPDSGHNAHSFRTMVTGDGVAHHDYYDGEGNHWQGDTRPFLFFWKNNMGTVSTEPPAQSGSFASPQWILIPLSTGKTLAVAGLRCQDARFTGALDVPSGSALASFRGPLPLPPTFTGETLQTLPCADGFQIVDHPAHGQKECFVDANLNLLTSFEDGEGNIWYGSSSLFALMCKQSRPHLVPGA